MKKVVSLGGGSGHAKVLEALKKMNGIEVTAVCPATDSGGSTGVLVREYGGGGYLGDLTKCVATLAEDQAFVKAFGFRYGAGSLDTHTVRNLFTHALIAEYGIAQALKELWRLARIFPHRVFPVSYESADLCAELSFGGVLVGETAIDTLANNPLWHPNVHAIDEVFLRPKIQAADEVVSAIRTADYVVICPGDLYSSLIPTLLPTGIKEAFSDTNAKIIIVLNLMTKKGETDGYSAHDFILKIEEKIGKNVDYIVHNNRPIEEVVLKKYYSSEQKVEFTAQSLLHDERLLEAPLAVLSEEGYVVTNPSVLRALFVEVMSR